MVLLIGESDEKFSLLCGFSHFDDGWYCAHANVSASGKPWGCSQLHGSEVTPLPEFMLLLLVSPLLASPPPARRSLAIRGANNALAKTGATIPGVNSVYMKMRGPTAGDKNGHVKIGSSARKSKRKNYRTIPQRRDISVDVRRVRRRLRVRVTQSVHQTLPVHQTLLVRQALARRARLVGAIELLISGDGSRAARGRIFHQLIPPFTAEAQTIAQVDETTTTQRQTTAALYIRCEYS